MTLNLQFTVVLICWFLIISAAVCGFPCSKCVCSSTGDSFTVDCSYRHLKQVPDLCHENVTTFILSGNQLNWIERNTFSKCINLDKLYLDRSGIHLIDNGSFEGLSRLRLLDLSYNYIGSDDKFLNKSGILAPLSDLEVLDLSSNTVLGKNKYSNLLHIMNSLAKTKLTTLKLQYVTNSDVYSENDITSSFMTSIKSSSLTKLDLSRNGIGYIYSFFRPYIPNIQDLLLGDNRLHRFEALAGLEHLRLVNISFQTKSGARSTGYEKHLSNEMSQRWPNIPMPSMSHKTFNVDNFSDCDTGGKSNFHLFFWPGNLTRFYARQVVDMGKVSSSFEFYVNNSENLTDLFVDFADNKVTEFMGKIDLCRRASDLQFDFSDNNCQNLSKNAFGKNLAEAIVSINLASNKLGAMLANDDGPISHMRNLIHLNLSYNFIVKISDNVFNRTNVQHLEELILGSNSLIDIPAGVLALRNLSFLDFSNNRILYLKAHTLSQLREAIKRKEGKGRKFALDLSGNPILCSCSSLEFLKFIYLHRLNIANVDKMTCQLDGRQVTLSRLHLDILPWLDKHCFSLNWLYAIVGLLGTTFVCLTVSAIAYRYRWDFKYFCLRLKIRRELYAELFEEEGAFYFDAFVAYSEGDLQWVHDYLVPNLEDGDNNFRLCVHHRDFEIGWPIEENILRAISSSRKTILVLSQHFIRSGWCKFEMHMARIHMMERGVDKLIIILLEELPNTDMPRTLVGIMRRHTYLVWPGEDMIDTAPVFWSRLRSTLRQASVNRRIEL